MPTISQVIIPVKDTSTGEITNQTFDLGGGGTSYIELTTEIAANVTTVTFTNAAITDTKTYDIYTSVFTSIKNVSISGTTLTITLKPVSSAMSVKVRIS
ncbi:MAG: hypothetical protein J6Y02_06595 [Pseudobutyrivibrio sp.]|nr:hypothetical protein [Pseudobutyrivibrio sp.]